MREFLYHVPYAVQIGGTLCFASAEVKSDGPLTGESLSAFAGAVRQQMKADGRDADAIVVLTPFLLDIGPSAPTSVCNKSRWCDSLSRCLGPIGDLRSRGFVPVALNQTDAGMQVVVSYREPKGRRADIYLRHCPFCGEDIRNGVFMLLQRTEAVA